jgi:hypothetical protein
VYHITAYRQLKEVFHSLPGDLSFWVYTSDAHIQMAIASWCKVFGSSKENAHYSKFSNQPPVSFDEYFITEQPCSPQVWEEYQREMRKFRDKYIAHREKAIVDFPVPMLDMALKAVFSYDRWTREVMAPEWNENELFEDRIVEWTSDIRGTLNSLIKPTSHCSLTALFRKKAVKSSQYGNT